MTTTSDLRLLSAEGLKGKTLAGNNVFLARTWATWDGSYPILYLHSPGEDMQSLGDVSAPQFTVTATIRVSARVEVRNLPRNGGAAAALAELEVIQQQIKMALINFPPLMKRLQQYPFVRSEIRESGEGDSELAELVMDIGMEFYQGPEDFYPLAAEIPGPPLDPAAEVAAIKPIMPLEQVYITNDLTNVVDMLGTYDNPPFPLAVNPAPRSVGPDGRSEGTLDIHLTQ
ncbi:phage tail protein [Pseudomonas sp. CCC3.2]|uniref:phage tail protein n=1 Tax=unclassified Pseudomonas TaxID=196821 RepID=UPI002AB59BBA|nr:MULTISPECIES: phage tail protein [unclassified Pseudomonas]MDY7560216.1 phage tail protein [Pseudomonas sp. AB6]MEB0178765.1 phage tail protein [Pseudomonas sp. CCC3.2]MEB0211403.1 phage tail protein [Pseudomonas sp. AB6]